MKRSLPLGISISVFCVALFLATAFGEAAGQNSERRAQAGPAGAGSQAGEAATPRRGPRGLRAREGERVRADRPGFRA